MWLPAALNEAAMAARGKISFYCGYGHPQVFADGEREIDVIRRERDRAVQLLAERDDNIRKLEALNRRHVSTARTLHKRIGNGVCACCNRSFVNLQRHMKSKHPEFSNG